MALCVCQLKEAVGLRGGVTRKIVSLKHSMKKEAQIRPLTYPSSIVVAERFQTEAEFLNVIGTKILKVFVY